MSHSPLRTETNCLNCGAEVTVRYCPVCGQENIVPKQTVWGLVTHFVFDIFHFDGKFFNTVGHLFTRPGHIPKEYTAGRRMRYLDPIRMYLFTSAFFFLLFFTLQNPAVNLIDLDGDSRSITKFERLQYASALHTKGQRDSLSADERQQLNFLLDSTLPLRLYPPTEAASDSSFLVTLNNEKYLLKVGPSGTSDSNDVVESSLGRKFKEYKRRFADDEQAAVTGIADDFLHKFPYLLFASLPFFALILKLLYIRRKPFFYSDHAVFTLYHYIFTFLLFLLFFLLRRAADWLGWGILNTVSTLVFLSGGVYLLLSMKHFYNQGWLKTVAKFLLLNILALVVLIFLMGVFIVAAFI